MNKESKLSQYVSQTMADKRISGTDIERATHKAISASQVNRIRSGDSSEPTASTMAALAKGLGVPITELVAAAQGVLPGDNVVSHERLMSIDQMYASLPKSKKSTADLLIKMIEREISALRTS